PAARRERLAGALLAALVRSGRLAATTRRLVAVRREQLAAMPDAEREALLAAFTAGLAGVAPATAVPLPPPPEPVVALRPDPALAALWDQAGMPCREGEPALAPDPLLVAPLPAASAALRGALPGALLPALDPALCTGCGVCWTCCPEGAW